jgi:hypothetical protein
VKFYTLIFNINENTSSEKEAQKLELEALEYHTSHGNSSRNYRT